MHEVVPLNDVTLELREKLRNLSRDVAEKISRCRNLEKSAWKGLADLESHVETIFSKIDNIAQKLVRMSVLCNVLIIPVAKSCNRP